MLAASDNERIRFWDVGKLADEEPWSEVEGRGPLAFSPSGNRLVAWRDVVFVRTGRVQKELLSRQQPPAEWLSVSLAFSRDGKALLTTRTSEPLCDAVTLQPIRGKVNRDHGDAQSRQSTMGVNVAAAFADGGKILVAGPHVDPLHVRRYDLRTEEIKRVTLESGWVGIKGTTGVAMSADGTRLAAQFNIDRDKDSDVHCWDTSSGKLVLLKGTAGVEHRLICLALDGKLLALRNKDGTVAVWRFLQLGLMPRRNAPPSRLLSLFTQPRLDRATQWRGNRFSPRWHRDRR